jgi:hypothetical protein
MQTLDKITFFDEAAEANQGRLPLWKCRMEIFAWPHISFFFLSVMA